MYSIYLWCEGLPAYGTIKMSHQSSFHCGKEFGNVRETQRPWGKHPADGESRRKHLIYQIAITDIRRENGRPCTPLIWRNCGKKRKKSKNSLTRESIIPPENHRHRTGGAVHQLKAGHPFRVSKCPISTPALTGQPNRWQKSLRSPLWQLEKSGQIRSWYYTNYYTICQWNCVDLRRFAWAAWQPQRKEKAPKSQSYQWFAGLWRDI